ncbi:MAG: hypothetical protein ACTSUR_02565 [Candidatus Heimdallarchaeaceae archaeon]
MIIKVKTRKNPFFLALLIGIYVALVVCVIVLAAISQNTGFWVASIVIDIILIVMGTFHFVNLLKPKYYSQPIGEVLKYNLEKEMENKEIEQKEENKHD